MNKVKFYKSNDLGFITEVNLLEIPKMGEAVVVDGQTYQVNHRNLELFVDKPEDVHYTVILTHRNIRYYRNKSR